MHVAHVLYIIYLSMQVRSRYSVDDHSHYLFTPRDLTQWVCGLLRYPLSDDMTSSNGVLCAWVYEGARLIRDRLVGE